MVESYPKILQVSTFRLNVCSVALGSCAESPKIAKKAGRKQLRNRRMVGERGFEPPTPWSRTKNSKNSKCFIWCRLGARKSRSFSPSVVPNLSRAARLDGIDDVRDFKLGPQLLIILSPLQLHFLTLQKTSRHLGCSNSFCDGGPGGNEEARSPQFSPGSAAIANQQGEEPMIIKKARFAVGIVTLSLIVVLVSSAVFAQRGSKRYEFGSDHPQQGQTAHLTGEWRLKHGPE